MSEQINSLVRKRGYIKTKLTRFDKYLKYVYELINNLSDNEKLNPAVIIELETGLARQETLLDEFNECQADLETLDDNFEEHILEGDLFENSFYKINAEYKRILSEHSIHNKPHSRSVSGHSSNRSSVRENFEIRSSEVQLSGVKLPQIDLPKFRGDYETWIEFRDTFTSLIHNNSSIPEISKFHYLRAQLEDGAKQVIHSLPVSNENYNTAWNLLCERYDNTKLLVYNHIKSIVDVPCLSNTSSSELRKMSDTISKHLRALQSLKQPVEHWDTLLIFLMNRKLDKETEREWEQTKRGTDLPTMHEFINFVKGKADLLETLEFNQVGIKQVKIKTSNQKSSKENHGSQSLRSFNQSSVFLTTNITCLFCKGSHYSNNCKEFLKLAVNERSERVNQLKLCRNCLRNNHFVKHCKASNCQKCKKRHHTLLHIDLQSSGSNNEQHNEPLPSTSFNNQTSTATRSDSNLVLSSQNVDESCEVLLSTALIQTKDAYGNVYTCRALLDSASQSNLITSELCTKLGLTKSAVNLSIVGVGQAISCIKDKCTLTIQSCCEEFQTTISCLVIPKICEQVPSIPIKIPVNELPQSILLADPNFNKPGKIDILLGASIFYSLLSSGQFSLGRNKPILQNTVLGWVVSGSVMSHSRSSKSYCNLITNLEVQQQLQKFWEIEDSSTSSLILSPDEQRCEAIFTDTVVRDETGRFVVTIPLKEPVSRLGGSRQMAINRFQSLERKFRKNRTFYEKYSTFMSEYERLGHMTKVMQPSLSNQMSYFMPHHGVFNENSVTTKLRVVFDGSAPSQSGWSFNDLQLIGPTIQNDLFSILLRFRKHEVVICADVEKMYRQVLSNPDQRYLQQILWRSTPSDEIQSYTLNTVTYGTSSAPFLAIRCLVQLADDHQVAYPIAAKTIKTDFYVDDMLTGAETIEEAVQLGSEVSYILSQGCFNLHKWISNKDSVLKALQTCNPCSNEIQLGDKNQTKTLGLYWGFKFDVLKYNISPVSKLSKITKRTILSDIAHIFDPLGLLSPCIIVAKILLQILWTYKLLWDDEIPPELYSKWQRFRDQLFTLNDLEIPRRVRCSTPIKLDLHGFSDAAQNAYGACVYIRSVSSNGTIHTSLLCSKSKVAPLKSISIPRLELCGALILSQLISKVKASMNLTFNGVFLWSDSTVALSWINMSPNLLQTFVANRVTQIQSLSDPKTWHHVRSADNPADLLSRGVDPNKLHESRMWWHGPNWLSQSEDSWPRVCQNVDEDIPELKQKLTCAVTTQPELFPFSRFSNFKGIQRSVAYCLRFAHNLKSSQNRKMGNLSKSELDDELHRLIKISQLESFPFELKTLQRSGSVTHKSSLLRLNPFLDPTGIIRVGGRLHMSKFNYDKKHPIVLSSKHLLTKLLFTYEHERLLHAGPQLLLSSIRDTYWPIGGRNLSKKIFHNCIRCFRANPKQTTPIMGVLPGSRVQQKPAFHTVGVDYAGPITIKDKKGRGCKPLKSYICLFICFTTRAIHLELVCDLTTESFIAAFRRFAARRGISHLVYSDNGKNFVGAASELRKFLEITNHELTNLFANEGVEWKFIPAHSPHFGGLWEAGVKSTKHHLKRILCNSLLTFDEMYTTLTQIEAALNSRPLTPLSSDPNDLDALTPAHFLIGQRITSLPDPNLQEIPENRLSRFQRAQQLQQHFWSRWSKEYISELQKRAKWSKNTSQLRQGSMVLIKDDKLPPLYWQLGRIIELYPGPDNVTRVALIKTKGGEVKRCFSKICVLPIE